jgi:hypothetical protein
MKGFSGQKTQRVLLCTWLIELLLDNLNKLEAASQGDLPDQASMLQKQQKEESVGNYQKAAKEFKTFLVEYEADLDSETVFQLLQSHGRLNDCLAFAIQKVHPIPRYAYIEKLRGDCPSPYQQ